MSTAVDTNNTHSTMAAETHHSAVAERSAPQEVAPKDAINYYLESLGTHRDFSIFHYKIIELPVIIYDKEEGFHIYRDMKAMEQEGTFTEVHHKIVHKNNPENGVTFDASITSLVVWQWLAMIIGIIMFFTAGKRAKKNPAKAPRGIHNAIEALMSYLREQVIDPNMPSKKLADKYQHYFYALFIFILLVNLIGLVPGGHSATGAIGTTLGLALISLFVINITAMMQSGVGTWFKHLLGGAPWWLSIIMVPIEIISIFTKPFALTIRLFANMTAGHIVLLSLVGLIVMLQSLVMAPVSVLFSLFMMSLELLVAFLQAYIFTILTAVFTNLAIGEHSAEAAH